tara:strand:- start:12065 stop:12862 length:798 start_codon:yes stop_codon:yes gene_type:complete
MSKMTLGTIEVTTPKTQVRRMSMIIWGPSGAGKTTLAATAPRPILWVNFDPDGTSSLMDQDGIYIADFSMENPNKVVTFKHENAGGIKQILEENPDIQTVVFDSVTSFNEMSLKHGITEVRGATMEMPTLQGYGRRNSYTMQGIMSVVKATGAANKHVIFIAHEDAPAKDELTGAIMVSILVGGKMQSEIPIKLSEVWHLEDTGKNRKITIRSSRLRKPMKSRMFISSGDSDFTWNFDPESWKGEGIADWYERWVDGNGKKINLP